MAWHHQRHNLNQPQVSLHHCNTDRVCISRVTSWRQTHRNRCRVSSKVGRQTQIGNLELAFQPESCVNTARLQLKTTTK